MRKKANMIRLAMAAAARPARSAALPSPRRKSQETPHYPLEHPAYIDWTFGGPFGKFDPQQLQRGFQVYREVCRDLPCAEHGGVPQPASESGPKFTEEQVKALAAEFEVTDGPDATGEMFQRPGRPSDHFRASFPTSRRRALRTAGPIRRTFR